ncbi:MAG: hypothetical protein IKG84_06975 [Bacteroidales bacterium]|nr:hypothetical protein [Bacteroidales bacterium]
MTDGLSAEYNRQVFPDGNHFDKDTRIWCITFVIGDGQTITCMHKLNGVRTLPRYYRHKNGTLLNTTLAQHLPECGEVPDEIDGHFVKQFVNYKSFLEYIAKVIDKFNGNIYFKGWYDHDYDKDVLKHNFDKYDITCQGLNKMVNCHINNNEWVKTVEQRKAGGWIHPHDYMTNAIKHNIEDAEQLMEIINNKG